MSSQKLAKNSISRRDAFDESRTVNQLHALHAKGAILNKRDWWVNWTTMPEVRAKWLHEMEETWVGAHLAHVWSQWPNRQHLGDDFDDDLLRIVDIAAITNPVPKASGMDRMLSEVLYPAMYEHGPFAEGALDEDPRVLMDKDIHDDNGETVDPLVWRGTFYNVLAKHKKLLPFYQIVRYVVMMVAREQFRIIPLDELTRARASELVKRVVARASTEVVNRTRQLILAVLREGACAIEVLRKHLPHEGRLTVLKLLQCHFTKISAMFEAVKIAFVGDLTMLVDELHLAGRERDPEAVVHVPGPVPLTWMSDNCIPAKLKSKFVAEMAALENVPDEMKDWNPNSNGQVLNLVDPSLFCGECWKTRVLASPREANLGGDPSSDMQAIMFCKATEVLHAPPRTPGVHRFYPAYNCFQWLPCEIDVTESGDSARIRTYINNLHPEDHAPLYNSIENIFARFVPLFDQVLSTLVDPHTAPVYKPTPEYSLAGSRCQVIVKIAEIVLTPEKPSYNRGLWHLEGTKAENIVATGLYYFGCENVTESRLSFCSFVNIPKTDQSGNMTVANSADIFDEKTYKQNLGSVIAMEDRCVVFPNAPYCKVEPFQLLDPTKPGTMKTLAFFLVNPTMDPIISTAAMPPQQQEWATRAQGSALDQLGVPDTVVNQIQDMGRDRMTLDQAKAMRLDLMEDRSPLTLDE